MGRLWGFPPTGGNEYIVPDLFTGWSGFRWEIRAERKMARDKRGQHSISSLFCVGLLGVVEVADPGGDTEPLPMAAHDV